MHRVRFALLSLLLLLALGTTSRASADELFAGPTRTLLKVEQFAAGFSCGLAACEITSFSFLPDKRSIVTSREGSVFLVSSDGKQITSAGKFVVSDGEKEKGLLNVLVHPEFGSK